MERVEDTPNLCEEFVEATSDGALRREDMPGELPEGTHYLRA